MEAFLDSQPVEHGLAGSEKLEALLAQINRGAADRGRALVSIECDGREIDAEGLAAARD